MVYFLIPRTTVVYGKLFTIRWWRRRWKPYTCCCHAAEHSSLTLKCHDVIPQAGVFEVLLVRLACMFDSQTNSMICLNGLVLRRESLHTASNARFLMDSMFDFAERMNALQLTDHEIGLFSAVVVIAPGKLMFKLCPSAFPKPSSLLLRLHSKKAWKQPTSIPLPSSQVPLLLLLLLPFLSKFSSVLNNFISIFHVDYHNEHTRKTLPPPMAFRESLPSFVTLTSILVAFNVSSTFNLWTPLLILLSSPWITSHSSFESLLRIVCCPFSVTNTFVVDKSEWLLQLKESQERMSKVRVLFLKVQQEVDLREGAVADLLWTSCFWVWDSPALPSVSFSLCQASPYISNLRQETLEYPTETVLKRGRQDLGHLRTCSVTTAVTLPEVLWLFVLLFDKEAGASRFYSSIYFCPSLDSRTFLSMTKQHALLPLIIYSSWRSLSFGISDSLTMSMCLLSANDPRKK